MALGIRQTLALAGSLIFAIPLGIYGIEEILGGAPVAGVLYIVVAALMVWLPQYLTTPGDLPGKVADGAIDRALDTDDEQGRE